MKVVFTPSFFRKYNKLSRVLQEEASEKIALFKENPNHPSLRIHKLKGALKGFYSFSVNYAYRILFVYDNRQTAALLGIGTHKVYE